MPHRTPSTLHSAPPGTAAHEPPPPPRPPPPARRTGPAAPRGPGCAANPRRRGWRGRCAACCLSLCLGSINWGMPTSDHPQATSSNAVRMIHVKRSDSCPTFRCFPTYDCATLGPLKVVTPLFYPRVEERDGRCTLGINRFDPVCLVTVAHRTRQKQIVLIMCAAPCLGNKVINLKQRSDDALRCPAVAAAKMRRFGHSPAECRWDALRGWTHDSDANCSGSDTSYPRCLSSTAA